MSLFSLVFTILRLLMCDVEHENRYEIYCSKIVFSLVFYVLLSVWRQMIRTVSIRNSNRGALFYFACRMDKIVVTTLPIRT